MKDVTVDAGKPLNTKNLKSMRIIEKVRVKPTLDTSWDALKDHREVSHGMYLFSKIDPPEVIAHYLQDLVSQGIDIFEFSMNWLLEHPPNFMKRMREPSERNSKKKTLKIGDSSSSEKLHVPLGSSAPSKSPISKAPLPSGSRKMPSSLPQPLPHRHTHTHIHILPLNQLFLFLLPHKPKTLQPQFLTPYPYNLNSTSLPISEAMLLNEPIYPLSSTLSSSPYYKLSSDFEQPHILNPSSPTLAQLQATTESE